MRTPSIYKTGLIAPLVLLVYCLLAVNIAFSQECPSPNTGFSVEATTAFCLGSGTATVSNVTGGSGTYEYQLVNPSNSGLSKPWQTSSSFTSVSAGSYELQIRSTCTTGSNIYSSVLTRSVTVGGNYQTLELSVETTPTCGTNGTITTHASKGFLAGGSGYRYALVPSLTEPEPIVTYVRPQQSSNLFTGLTPGTYYVRVYDDCSDYASYRTIQAIILDNTTDAPQLRVTRYLKDCDSEFLTIALDFGVPATPGSFTFVYPNGTREPLTITPSRRDTIHVTSNTFGTPGPNNHFFVEYTDPCGNLTQYPAYTYNPYSLDLSFGSHSSGCATAAFRPLLTVKAPPLSMQMTGNQTYYYSIDGGPIQTHTSPVGPDLLFPKDGRTHSITVEVCGISETFEWTAPLLPTTIPLSIFERNANSCNGRSGFTTNADTQLTLHFTSVPNGQTIPPDQIASIIIIDNLLPGSYSFTISNGCLIKDTTFVLEHPLDHTIEVKEGLRCDSGQSGIDVDITGHFYTQPGNLTSQTSQSYTTQVYNSQNVLIGAQFHTVIPSALTSPQSFSKHFALNPGTYRIVVIKTGGCSVYEKVITINGNHPIVLEQLLATSFCPTEGFTVVQASGGVGPYQYTLYENSIAVPNRLAGPQPGNAFTGLSPDKTYFVAATDECGAGINIQTQFSTVPITTALSSESQDCLGERVLLEVYGLPGATYQWYKNGLPIPSATNSTYEIPVLDNTDFGVYKVFVTVGTCDDYTTDIELTGLHCTPYPVRISSFSAKKEGTIALVTWTTSFEENSDHFEVQHSTTGRTWQTTGRVQSKGTSASENNYTFAHTSPLNGSNYYRLKMVDQNGSYSFSPIRSVRFDIGAELLVYPNPAIDWITIKATDNTPVSSITVYDLTGIELQTASVSKDGTVNLGSLPTGTYLLKIHYATGASTTEKIKLLQ